jgi:hypothetical protein
MGLSGQFYSGLSVVVAPGTSLEASRGKVWGACEDPFGLFIVFLGPVLGHRLPRCFPIVLSMKRGFPWFSTFMSPVVQKGLSLRFLEPAMPSIHCSDCAWGYSRRWDIVDVYEIYFFMGCWCN